jgi:hypothetical protein
MDDRLAAWQTVDDDVEKTPEIAAEPEEQSSHHEIGQQNDPLVHQHPVHQATSKV